jgi:hypothetical protein
VGYRPARRGIGGPGEDQLHAICFQVRPQQGAVVVGPRSVLSGPRAAQAG